MPTCLLSLVWNFALSWVVLFTLWRHPWSFTVTRMAKWNIFFQVIRYSKYSRTTCTVISMYTCATLPLLLKLCTILGSLVLNSGQNFFNQIGGDAKGEKTLFSCSEFMIYKNNGFSFCWSGQYISCCVHLFVNLRCLMMFLFIIKFVAVKVCSNSFTCHGFDSLLAGFLMFLRGVYMSPT